MLQDKCEKRSTTDDVDSGLTAKSGTELEYFMMSIEFFTMEDLNEARKSDKCAEMTETFMPCVVGKTSHNRKCAKLNLSKMASRSDEAFMLLLLENNCNKWVRETLEDSENGSPKTRHSGEHTTNATTKGARKGWDEDGMKRFVEMLKKIKMQRDEPSTGATFDTEFKKTMIEKKGTNDRLATRHCVGKEINATDIMDEPSSDEGEEN